MNIKLAEALIASLQHTTELLGVQPGDLQEVADRLHDLALEMTPESQREPVEEADLRLLGLCTTVRAIETGGMSQTFHAGTALYEALVLAEMVRAGWQAPWPGASGRRHPI